MHIMHKLLFDEGSNRIYARLVKSDKGVLAKFIHCLFYCVKHVGLFYRCLTNNGECGVCTRKQENK